MFISNFQIAKDTTAPWLEVQLTASGMVRMDQQIKSGSQCDGTAQSSDVIDVTDATFEFYMFDACKRTPVQVPTSGVTEAIDAKLGQIRYKWALPDTSKRGMYYVGWKVTLTDGSIFKWPYQLESLSVEVT